MKCSDCSKEIKPVVAFDIDGTLGMYHSHFQRFCSKYFGVEGPSLNSYYSGHGDFEEYLGLTREQYREAKLAYRQGGTKRWMPQYPGAYQFVRSVKEMGAEVWVATTRPWQRLDNIDPDTREWLRRNEIQYDGLLYGDDKYDQLCEHVEADRIVSIVEDLPEQIMKAQRLNLPTVHMYRYHNEVNRFEPGTDNYDVATQLISLRLQDWRDRYGANN